MSLVLSFLSFTSLVLAAPPTRAAACAHVQDAAGTWRFTTLVTEAKAKANKGVTGYYQLTLAAEGCTLHATLTKTGYGAKTFKPDQVQTATFDVSADTLPPSEDGEDVPKRPGEALLKFAATLKGGGVELPLTFEIIASKDQLVGRWQYEGDAWTKAGMAGVLLGARGEGKSPALTKHKQIGCARACDLEGYYYESNSRLSCEDLCQAGRFPKASHHE